MEQIPKILSNKLNLLIVKNILYYKYLIHQKNYSTFSASVIKHNAYGNQMKSFFWLLVPKL